ncbi:hypothetical protein, partial [Microbacterium sp. BF1]|uniref:hypothetical protein n=1 Tax=Microbacterium sp. BF1 TaxID=2821146 RepID=UPI001C4DE2ED
MTLEITRIDPFDTAEVDAWWDAYTASAVQWQEFSDSRQGGEFQLIVGGVIGTSVADPFQIYRDWFGGTA